MRVLSRRRYRRDIARPRERALVRARMPVRFTFVWLADNLIRISSDRTRERVRNTSRRSAPLISPN